MKFLLRLIVVALLSTPAMADPTANATQALQMAEAAEAEQRWEDAARHYADLVRLEPSVVNLIRAHRFSRKLNDIPTASIYSAQMVDLARAEGVSYTLASALGAHSWDLANLGNYDAAEPLYRELVEVNRSVFGSQSPYLVVSLDNLAILLGETGREAEAETLLREAVMVARQAYGAEHPDYANQLNDLANLLIKTGRLDEADPLLREAVEVMETAKGVDDMHAKILRNSYERFLANRPPQ
ncbi:hypothetical protein ATO10_00040 [Actibacterium atlanticum]|uniref:Tetratricopeptide repeat protein n=1 Tax=Actibacterium atlanticum TaxID=1461693 RepID=A0A058ZNF8_9RHOB|nr:tetratricopeptide repeat protein [Actibacterium atlanticum]KCV83103.1 hypothetical protein ATO10_00040 [Actibacterium atlanticum]